VTDIDLSEDGWFDKYEALIDRRVQARLATDPAYRNAENAEEQKQREEQIEEEELVRLNREISEAETRRRQQAQAREFEAAHAEGLHDDVPREFCPICDARRNRS
jgi:hypothetical protein